MKKMKNILFKVMLTILGFILLWIILMGILDYDVVIYEFNPIILVLGIVIYIILVRVIYLKLIPKIENNKIIPFIFIRYLFYIINNFWTSTKSQSFMGYGRCF